MEHTRQPTNLRITHDNTHRTNGHRMWSAILRPTGSDRLLHAPQVTIGLTMATLASLVVPFTSTPFQVTMGRMLAPHPEAFEEPYETCATCGHGLCDHQFVDVESLKEATISRTCQPCQDIIFAPNQEDQ